MVVGQERESPGDPYTTVSQAVRPALTAKQSGDTGGLLTKYYTYCSKESRDIEVGRVPCRAFNDKVRVLPSPRSTTAAGLSLQQASVNTRAAHVHSGRDTSRHDALAHALSRTEAL